MKTLETFMSNLLVSLLTSDTVSPPEGAGADNVIGSSTIRVIPVAWNTGITMDGDVTTDANVAVVGTNGNAPAWMTAVPVDTPVTGTFTVVAFGGSATVAG